METLAGNKFQKSLDECFPEEHNEVHQAKTVSERILMKVDFIFLMFQFVFCFHVAIVMYWVDDCAWLE